MRRLLLAPLVLAAAAAAERGAVPDFEVETHPVAGTSLREARVTVHAAAPPAAILAVLWDHTAHPGFLPRLKRLDILHDGGDERLIYQQIAVPIGRDRDVVLRVRRTVDAASGVVDVRSSTVTDAGPPAAAGHVRVGTSAGHWHLVPARDGGTDLTYTLRTDGGDGLIGWIAGRAQRQAVADHVRAVLERAARVPAAPRLGARRTDAAD